ncbi:hypothetical protein [Caulobacter sp.]|uniref:hypothetical protein n=1 Tax=Caulobacter sp. TaxID=78 RepID=UPI001B2D9D98|nr:hypothetical protein [Caulobacter sp.]MBO9547168.1 hypothetical protein [Caulobacter sp.]
MSRIEGEFLTLALEIGLAETIAETLRGIDRSIAELPSKDGAVRYRRRLEEQRVALRNPSLRTSAALVVSMCAKDTSLTPRIRRAFANLAERHPELAWFYAQLPEEALRRAG